MKRWLSLVGGATCALFLALYLYSQVPASFLRSGLVIGHSVAQGSNGLVGPLEEHTASNSAALSFTSWYSSSYDDYLIQFVSVQPGTNDQALLLNFSTNGGSSYDTSAIYDFGEFYVYNSGGNTGSAGGSSQTAYTVGGGVGSTGSYGFNDSLHLANPGSASIYKMLYGQSVHYDADVPGSLMQTSYGVYRNTAAVNAFQATFSSGNIAAGTIRVYGYSK